jgi:hypothetical protein
MLLEPGLRERLSVGARRQIRHFSSRKSAIRAVAMYDSLRVDADVETSATVPASAVQ